MKKFIFVFVSSITLNSFTMDSVKKISSNALTTLYDKYDPETVLSELEKEGVSKNIDEKMTQEHRVNRTIRHYVQANEPQKLCNALSRIVAGNFPRSPLAIQMAHEYLVSKRAAVQNQPSIFTSIIQTLDKLNSSQITKDLSEGQTFGAEKRDLESRVNAGLEILGSDKKDQELQKLIQVLGGLQKTEKAIVPGPRVAQDTSNYLEQRIKELTQTRTLLNQLAKSIEKEKEKEK